MKKLIIMAAMLMLLIIHKSEAQTVTVFTDSTAITQTPESYFYKRTDGHFNAIAIKIAKAESGAQKVTVKYTVSGTVAARPASIKVKYSNGQASTHTLKFIRKADNDNREFTDNVFMFIAKPEDLKRLQTLTIQSIVLLTAQQATLVEIPVNDGASLRSNVLKLAAQKEN